MRSRNKVYIGFLLLMVILSVVYMVNPSGTASQHPAARIIGQVPYRIPSASMAPTLLPGDFILVDSFAYSKQAPQRREIIVFSYPVNPKMAFVKRVAGIPGDRIEVIGEHLFVNGEQQNEPYLHPFRKNRRGKKPYSTTVPEGKLFVLGDNRDHSADSRVWGFVPLEEVVGRVHYIWLSDTESQVGPVRSGIIATDKGTERTLEAPTQ